MSTQITLMRDMLALFLKEGRRRIVTLGLLFSALAFIGLVVGMILPKKWEASALLIAEERNIIKPLMEGRAVPTTIGDQKAVVNQVVLSHRILREVLAFGGWLPRKISAQDEERLLVQMKSRIKISSPRDELIRISYQDSDRWRTFKVANKLAEIYVREGAAAKERESREAFDFISKRVQEYGDKLTLAQQDLLAHYNGQDRGAPRAAVDIVPEGSPPAGALRGGVTPAQLATLRAEEATLSAQIGRRSLAGPSESRQTEDQYRSRVLQLEAEVNRLITRYTDEYPEVKRAKRDLEIARQDLETAEKARGDRESARAAASALDDGVTRAARARLDEVQRQISAATGIRRRPTGRGALVPAAAVATGTEREMRDVGTDTTLSGLYRHYEATRDVYQDLLKRRENARVSMDLDVERRGLTLRIQEAAELPATAISMRLLHSTTVALLIAFLVPLGLLFALVRLDPKVRSGWQIERFSRVAVLAAIPDAPAARYKSNRRRQELLVVLMVGGVFLIYGVVFLIKQKMSS